LTKHGNDPGLPTVSTVTPLPPSAKAEMGSYLALATGSGTGSTSQDRSILMALPIPPSATIAGRIQRRGSRDQGREHRDQGSREHVGSCAGYPAIRTCWWGKSAQHPLH